MKNVLLIIFLSFFLLSCSDVTPNQKARCAEDAAFAKTDRAADLMYKACIEKAKQYNKIPDKGTFGEQLKNLEKGKKSSKSTDWSGIIIIILFIGFFYLIAMRPNFKTPQKVLDEEDARWGNLSKISKEVKSKNKKNKSKSLLNSIWMGEKSLGKTFWLYYLLINGIASYLIITLFMEEHKWVFLIFVTTNIYTGIAVWRSANNYKIIQVKKKKSNVWGILAKISVCLNFLQIASATLLLFSII